jgi:hypothetical protein
MLPMAGTVSAADLTPVDREIADAEVLGLDRGHDQPVHTENSIRDQSGQEHRPTDMVAGLREVGQKRPMPTEGIGWASMDAFLAGVPGMPAGDRLGRSPEETRLVPTPEQSPTFGTMSRRVFFCILSARVSV